MHTSRNWQASATKIRTYPKRTDSVGVKDSPELYTSIAHWKPVTPEQFLKLLHGYSVDDPCLDENMHGLMTSTSFRVDPQTFGTIWYIKKAEGSSVSSPVLLTLSSEERLMQFASTQYGALGPSAQ